MRPPPPLRLSYCLLWLLITAALGCASVPRGSGSFDGFVVHVGSEGVPALERDGHARTFTGPERLVVQLDRLPGASVSVRGALIGDDRLRVRGFVIQDPGDGLTPMVGRLVVDQTGVIIQDENTGTELLLQGEPLVEMRRHHGGRVWVTGSVVGKRRVLVAHWGLLLTATEAERLR